MAGEQLNGIRQASASGNRVQQPYSQPNPGQINVDFAMKNPLNGNLISTNVPLDESRAILPQLAEQGLVGFTETSYGLMVTSILVNGTTLRIDPKSNRVTVTNSDGTYYYDSDEPIGFSFFRQEVGNPNAPFESFFKLELGNVVEIGPDRVKADALKPTNDGKEYFLRGEVSGAHAESKSEELKQVGDNSFISTADAKRIETSYDTIIPSEELYSFSNVSILQINPSSMFNFGLRQFSRLSYNVQRSLASIVLPAIQGADSLRRMLIPPNLYQLTELELARRQRMLALSDEHRLQRMLLFDAAAPSNYGNPSYFGSTDNFSPDNISGTIASSPSMPGLNFFSDGAKDWSGGQPPSPDSDFGDGGERMRSGTREAGKAQQGNLDKLSNYSESSGGGSGNSGFGSDDYFGRSGGERTKQDAKPQTKSHYKNAASASNSSSLNSSSGGFSGSGSKNPSAKTGGSNAPGSSSKKSGGEAASAKPAHAPPNFQMQSPMSEGKTQVQNAGLAVHSPAQNVSAAQKIQPPASIAQMQPLQAHFESMQTITQMQEVRVQQQAIAREQATIHQEHSEAPQQIAMHEQPTAQQEQLAATMHQEQSVQAMLQEPQAQTVPIAVQRIRTEKKKAGEKILPRIPIPVSSNADNGKNKKENSMNAINEKEKITPVAQIMAPVPRRVSPTGIVALIPLRNLFERKGKNKKEEKHECASKVCGWCGRKAA